MHEGPQFPVGPPDVVAAPASPEAMADLISEMGELPRLLRQTVSGLGADALDTRYRNWTVRQIVHHVADSHAHAYLRTKLALTERTPTVMAYDEDAWSGLAEARGGPVEPSLAMLDGLHERWAATLRAASADEIARTFFHPQRRETVSLADVVVYYAWHGRHHAGQIRWLRRTHGW